jgi:hypothetical protein
VRCQVNRKCLRNTFALNGQEPEITSRWLANQLLEVTRPTARASATAHSLGFPEATRLQFAPARDIATMARQMATPSLQRPKSFKRGASHTVCG